MIGEFLALFASFCWAFSAVLYRKVLENKGYFIVNLLRVGFASLFLAFFLPFLLLTSQLSSLTFNEILLFIFAAVNGPVIGDTLYFIGLKRVGVSRTQSISSSYPLFSMVLATIFLHENLSFAIIVGTPLIVIGIILVLPIENKNRLNSLDSFSKFTPVLTAFFWSIALITFKFILNNSGINPIFATFINRLFSLPFLFFTAIAVNEFNQIKKLSKIEVVLISVAGIVSLGIGGISVFLSLSLLDASKAIPLSSVSPFFTLILALIYIKEKLNFKIFVGTILIVTGIFLLTFC
ncbi:MAG: EamA family transporter [Candidatus Bathyarchaeia archaeon]|nr:DMT family transporter [Candidatus Bathyarchaeota archaeon]